MQRQGHAKAHKVKWNSSQMQISKRKKKKKKKMEHASKHRKATVHLQQFVNKDHVTVIT